MVQYIGYHGTSSTIAKRIMQTNFKANLQQPGWLGSGIYFFEEDEKLARYFGGVNLNGPTSVLRAEIDIPDELVLDISVPYSEGNKEFHAYRDMLVPTLVKKGVTIKSKNKKDYDGKVLNILCSKQGYKLVKNYTFTYQEYDRENYTSSRVPNGIELCLKDNGYIVEKQII